MSEPTVVTCPSCGAANRVVPERVGAGQEARCGRCQTPLPTSAAPVTVTDGSWDELVVHSPLPVMVDLWAPWCGPCRMVAPIVAQIAGEMAGRWRIAKLNTDENPEVSARLQIQGIPTLVFYRDGREVDRLIGAYPKEAILSRIAALS